MATVNLALFPAVNPTVLTQRYHPTHLSPNGFSSSSSSLSLRNTTARSSSFGNDFLGDFGARDPFPAEIESQFGDKVLGNVSTEHKILIPNISALSLSQQDCTTISPLQPPISQRDATQLVRKVLGWRLVNEEGVLKLQCLWKLRDFKSGVELINRISKVVEAAGNHFPNIHLEQPNQVRAELWTPSIASQQQITLPKRSYSHFIEKLSPKVTVEDKFGTAHVGFVGIDYVNKPYLETNKIKICEVYQYEELPMIQLSYQSGGRFKVFVPISSEYFSRITRRLEMSTEMNFTRVQMIMLMDQV